MCMISVIYKYINPLNYIFITYIYIYSIQESWTPSLRPSRKTAPLRKENHCEATFAACARPLRLTSVVTKKEEFKTHVGLSENVGYIPNDS